MRHFTTRDRPKCGQYYRSVRGLRDSDGQPPWTLQIRYSSAWIIHPVALYVCQSRLWKSSAARADRLGAAKENMGRLNVKQFKMALSVGLGVFQGAGQCERARRARYPPQPRAPGLLIGTFMQFTGIWCVFDQNVVNDQP